MKIDIGAQSILRQMARTDKALGNTQAQIASGLKNPNPATDPLASTLAKRISTEVSTTKLVQSVVSQAKNTVEIAWGTLRANTDILNKMKAQAIEASNGIYTSIGRSADLDPAFQANIAQLDSNALATWGSRTLFDGSFFMNCQTDTNVVEAHVTGSVVTAALNDGDLTINGVNIGATADTAEEMIAAINAQTSITQVTASALDGTISLSSVSPILIGGTGPENAGLTSETIAASGITAITFADMRSSAIFGSSLPDLTTQTNAKLAISAIDAALGTVLNEMTRLSLYSAKFENIEENMEVMSLDLQNDLSVIEDVDFAAAISDSERLKVIKDAAMATLKTQFTFSEKLAHLVADSLRGH